MALEFRFPDVGEGIHEGRIVEWLVKPGDAVAMDQPFVKVETDKAVVDLPAPKAAVVRELRFGPGDTIHVGDVMIVFGVEGEAAQAAAPAVPAAPAPRAEAAAPAAPARPPSGGRALATPHTRALARRLGVDIAAVAATGRGGRVTDEDVERAATGGEVRVSVDGVSYGAPVPAPAAPPRPPAEITADGPVERVAVSHLRRVIAEAMSLSKRTSPHVTHVDEADVTDLLAAYGTMKAEAARGGVKFSLTALFVKAAVAMLKAHPKLNASYDEAKGELLLKRYYNLGVAVDTPEGLIVPVLKDADKKDLMAVAASVQDLAARARERRLSLDELKGGTFTVTNIGPVGGLAATPIIHQPELAILAFFAVKERPAVWKGQVAVRKIMNVALGFDHRIIDGAEAARAVSDLVRLLEAPELLMLRM